MKCLDPRESQRYEKLEAIKRLGGPRESRRQQVGEAIVTVGLSLAREQMDILVRKTTNAIIIAVFSVLALQFVPPIDISMVGVSLSP